MRIMCIAYIIGSMYIIHACMYIDVCLETTGDGEKCEQRHCQSDAVKAPEITALGLWKWRAYFSLRFLRRQSEQEICPGLPTGERRPNLVSVIYIHRCFPRET